MRMTTVTGSPILTVSAILPGGVSVLAEDLHAIVDYRPFGIPASKPVLMV